MGDASLSAGDICGGVEESSEELNGAASSESPEEENSHLPIKYTVVEQWFCLDLLMCKHICARSYVIVQRLNFTFVFQNVRHPYRDLLLA